tara:strand:+ start:2748 stop:3155 length:408 start_codon:yes stop_codon:yes gene_type:complete
MTWQDILKVKRTTKLLNAKKVKAYVDKRMAKYPDSPPNNQSIARALNISLDEVREALKVMEGEYEDLSTRLKKYCEMHRNDPEPIPIPMKEKMGKKKKKLVGGQKKLDTDNDGDIDAKDLKRLRSKGRGFTGDVS